MSKLEPPPPPPANAPKIRLVVATRENREGFLQRTATGRSLAIPGRPVFPQVEVFLQEQNSDGLSVVYNRAIEAARRDPAVLVFIHDDVHLCDAYWAEQALAAVETFHVAGLAGNRRRVPKQPSWAFIDEAFTWDQRENLSGMVGEGKGFPPRSFGYYGPSRQAVKLLDGLMLIARSETLLSHDIRFDERFAFQFYDMDFCRQVEAKGLTLGTWPISVVHESNGEAGYASEAWRMAYRVYLQKWGEA